MVTVFEENGFALFLLITPRRNFKMSFDYCGSRS